MRIIFAGTPVFAVETLKSLLTSKHEVCAVYTQPDRPAGRGRKLTASPVKELAQAHQIPVEQPLNFKNDDTFLKLESYDANLMVVVAYGLILPQRILDTPTHGCLNIHASLLPKWRGAAPIQRAIFAGDNTTGVCIMQMEAGLDTGPVLSCEHCHISPEDTAQTLHDRLAVLGAKTLMDTLENFDNKQIIAKPQDEAFASYAQKLNKAEATIDWSESALNIARQVQAFNPWPVAQTILHDQVFRVWIATAITEAASAPPGSIVSVNQDSIEVATGDGILRLQQVQTPGKRAMPVADFLNANRMAVGETLG